MGINQIAVRRIIVEAFREFRSTVLSPAKLREFEEIICSDTYLVPPDVAAEGILKLVEDLNEVDLVSSMCESIGNNTTPQNRKSRKSLTPRGSMSNSIIMNHNRHKKVSIESIDHKP